MLKEVIDEKESLITKRKEVEAELEYLKKFEETELNSLQQTVYEKEKELTEKEDEFKDEEQQNEKIKKFLDDIVKSGKIDNLDQFSRSALPTVSDRSSSCIKCTMF